MDPTGRHRGVPVWRCIAGGIVALALVKVSTPAAIAAIILLAAMLMRDVAAEH